MSRLDEEMKFDAFLNLTASAKVVVELSDEDLVDVAEELEKDVEDLTTEDLWDKVYEKVEPPRLCAQCSGFGQNYTLELHTDDFELGLDMVEDDIH